MNAGKIRKLTFSGLFAALCFVLTLTIRIPTPTGFIHPGDCAVLLGAALLGPGCGFAAAAVGSALADVAAGYAIFAPFTFLIKGLMALFAALLSQRLPRAAAYALSALFMTAAYLGAELLLGFGAAALQSVPGNLLQGFVGGWLCLLLHRLLAPAFGRWSGKG